jgi:peptidoglycan hydrolase FlgJ
MTVQKLTGALNYDRLKEMSPRTSEKERLKKACKDFEAIFMNQMLDSMRETLTNTSVFGNSLGKDIYKSMYYRQLTSDIAQGGNGLGIGELLYNKLESKVKENGAASENQLTADDNSIGKIKE